MKRNLIFIMTFALALCGWTSCNGANKQSDESTIDVEKYWAQFQDMYEEDDLDDIHEELTKYAFIDIDGDGVNEVWLRSENDEDGAIFCFDDKGEPVLIITETEGKRPSIAKGWVGIGYPAGGPTYFNQYVILKNSRILYNFTDLQIEESHEYYCGDKEITKAEAKKIKAHIKGEGNLPTDLEWHQRSKK